jgi:hypothetical protein
VEDYSYQIVCGGKPVLPEHDDFNVSEEQLFSINAICDELCRIDVPRPVTTVRLTTSPGKYLPLLKFILEKYETEFEAHRQAQDQPQYHQQDQQQRKPTFPQLLRLFSMLPLPSLKWRYITINPNALAAIAKLKLSNRYEEQLKMFSNVFDLGKFKIKRYFFVLMHSQIKNPQIFI